MDPVTAAKPKYRRRLSDKWYKLPAWKGPGGIRERQLHKQPLCESCLKLGFYVAANTCDHVEPHNDDWDKFWAGPFQSLCADCHSAGKQKEERAGFSAEADDEGFPTDPRHPFNRIRVIH
jgi:hypothetical protein